MLSLNSFTRSCMYLLVMSSLLLSTNVWTQGTNKLSVGSLVINTDDVYKIPEGVTDIAISNLIMESASSIEVPYDSKGIKITVNRGLFKNRTGIYINRGEGKGRDITLEVKEGTFTFDSEYRAIIRRDSEYPKLQIRSMGMYSLTRYFSVNGRGGTGAKGAKGADGASAKRKACSNPADGEPAQNGFPGNQGGQGYDGPNITAIINLVPNHPVISNNEISLNSYGGFGGDGGDGGNGGNGAAPKKCLGYKRGGHPAGNPGPPGPTGDMGNPGVTNLELNFK